MQKEKKRRSVNEILTAIEIIRQILALRYSLHVRNLVIKRINETEYPIARMVRDALQTDAGLRDPAQVRQLDALIDQINIIRRPAWLAGRQLAEAELNAMADGEVEDQRDIFNFLLPGITLAVPGSTAASAFATPFQGRTLGQWFDDAATDDARRIRQVIYLGAAAGEAAATVARRVVGSTAAKGTDGATQISRNAIDAIVRSGLVHVASFSRDQFYRANESTRYTVPTFEVPDIGIRGVGEAEDPISVETRRQVQQTITAAQWAAGGLGIAGTKIFLQEQYVAVLDNRTTNLCRGLDGKIYKLGKGPIPPLHMNCRSLRIIVLSKALGGDMFDPGKYGTWIGRQPNAVSLSLMGKKASEMRVEELADVAFQDYGARPMTLRQVRDEARRLIMSY